MPRPDVSNQMMGKGPQSITIRMYNVGFGDCFLITFEYGDRNRNVLIDFGSTSAPKSGSAKYMQEIAQDIKNVCSGKLDVLVATHRHSDHISGFSTDGTGTGKIIASLRPDHVIQPWTEDPYAPANALTATTPLDDHTDRHLTAQFLGSLEDMHSIAAEVVQQTGRRSLAIGPEKRNQLAFLGQANMKNSSAVNNLIAMGKAGRAHYVNAGMKLDGLLPGVKITVLGPPTLKQSSDIRTERAKDPSEFWQFRSFWATQCTSLQSHVNVQGTKSYLSHKTMPRSSRSPDLRWFIEQSQRIHADQILQIVRDLDDVMNNTSVILLFETGDQRLLFPGDAQIENWSFALKNPEWCKLLRDVNLYKVGHHGSLNGTPKSLWKLFGRKGQQVTPDRLDTCCSTKKGKHGSVKAGTEVPRGPLIAALKENSNFSSTEDLRAPDPLVWSTKLRVQSKNNSGKRSAKRPGSESAR